MHVAEQVREVDECVAETGKRPVELLGEHGLSLGPLRRRARDQRGCRTRRSSSGQARAFACVCATRPNATSATACRTSARCATAGVRLCTGIDSHVVTDPIDDLRALETHERLRTRHRVTFRPAVAGEGPRNNSSGSATPATQLWHEGSVNGAVACGFADAGGHVVLRRDHPSIALVDDEFLLDAIVFGCGPSIVELVEAT